MQAGVSYVEFTERIPPEEVPQYEAIAQRLEARWGLIVRFNNAYFRTASAAEQDAQVQAMPAPPAKVFCSTSQPPRPSSAEPITVCTNLLPA